MCGITSRINLNGPNVLTSNMLIKSSSVTLSVDLPQNINHTMQFTVKIDGVDPKSVPIYPGVTTHNFSVTGRDTTTVQVFLDDQLYREFRVDFNSKSYETVAANEYVDVNQPQDSTTAVQGEN